MPSFADAAPQMWLSFAIIAAAVVSYAWERVSIELTSMATIVALALLFYVYPLAGPDGEALVTPAMMVEGFGNPALITILSLLVVGQGLFQTGALNEPVRRLLALGGGRPRTLLFSVYICVMVVSAFLNNTPVAIMFIPVLVTIVERLRVPTSRVMIPLSYVCVLGGMTTLIGSSTNLLTADAARTAGLPPIGFFDFTFPGLVLAGAGFVYVLLVTPRLLPDRATMAGALVAQTGKQFIAQIDLTRGHPLVGIEAVAGLFPKLPDLTVRLIHRGERTLLPPFDDITLSEGDTVIVAATRKALTDILTTRPKLLVGDGLEAPDDAEVSRVASERMLAEAIVAPGSRLIGQSLAHVSFPARTGCLVLGIQRRSRMLRASLDDIRLEAGDVLLLVGSEPQMEALRADRDLVVLESSATALPALESARTALAIFGAVVVAASTGILPTMVAGLTGAMLMIASGALNLRQAGRAIDRRIVLIVAASLAMGTALQATGGAAFLGNTLVAVFSGFGAAAVLSALFLLIAVLTNLLSNNATAVLFAPIAVSAANALGVPPEVFVYAVIFAANCSFATPMAYQTNLLVMGPGHYRFGDFVRAGSPLILLLWIVFSVFAPWYYGV